MGKDLPVCSGSTMPFTKRTTAIAYDMRVADAASALVGGYGKRSAATSACRRWRKAGHEGHETYTLICCQFKLQPTKLTRDSAAWRLASLAPGAKRRSYSSASSALLAQGTRRGTRMLVSVVE